MEYLYYNPTLKSQVNIDRKRGRNTVRASDGGWLQGDIVFQTYHQGWCRYELTETVCSVLAQVQGIPSHHIKKGKWTQSPTLTQKFFAIDSS